MPRHELQRTLGRRRPRPAREERAVPAEAVEPRVACNSFPGSDLDGVGVSNARADGLVQNEALLCLNAFDVAVDRLGRIADEMHSLVLSSSMAIALIESEGDRIDRLIVENQESLDDLLAGKW